MCQVQKALPVAHSFHWTPLCNGSPRIHWHTLPCSSLKFCLMFSALVTRSRLASSADRLPLASTCSCVSSSSDRACNARSLSSIPDTYKHLNVVARDHRRAVGWVSLGSDTWAMRVGGLGNNESRVKAMNITAKPRAVASECTLSRHIAG